MRGRTKHQYYVWNYLLRKLAFWMSLVLIFTIPWEDSLSIPALGSFTRLLGLVVAGFWFLTILTEGRFRKPHLFHALVLLFFLWNIVSYIWSVDVDRTVQRILTYGQIFVLMLIIWELFQKPADLIAGLQAYVLGSYVCIASSIYNYLHGIVAENFEVRYTATGVNAVDLALFLLLGLPVAWHLFTHFNHKNNFILKVLNIAFIPLAIFSILLTASRTSLFAVVPAIIFILWPKRIDVGRFILIAIFLVVSLLVMRAILPAGIVDRLATASASISAGDIGGRVTMWKETITIFLRNPLFGNGSGVLPTIIGSLAHQTFLSVLAETGLIGFGLFVCILATVINQAVRLPKGYLGLWLSSFFVWFIGVLSLSFEFRKVTWLFLSFVIIEGAALHEQYLSEKLNSTVSESEEDQSLIGAVEPNG
jgi:O-antigen ligase